MRILSIALKDLKIMLKDKRSMAIVLLMPIILIFILGISLGSMFEDDDANISQFKVGFVDQDKTDASKEVKEFLETDEVEEYAQVVTGTEDKLRERLKNGELAALIIVSENYEKNIDNKKDTSIRIIKDKGSELTSGITESILESYAKTYSSVLASSEAAGDQLEEYQLPGEAILENLKAILEDTRSYVGTDDMSNNGSGITAMQYYSAAMIAMFILFVGMLGTTMIIEEREENTLSRLMTTRAGKATILAGKFLGLFILGLLIISIMLLITKFVFNVDWGNSMAGLLLLSAALSFSACGLAILIATMFRSSAAVDIINPVLIMGMAFIGGNMYPIYEMSPFLQKVGHLFLNNWGLRGYLYLMVNNGLQSILLPSAVLFSMGVIFITIGVARLKL